MFGRIRTPLNSYKCLIQPAIQREYGFSSVSGYCISSNRSPRLLLEPLGSPMNMTLFKIPRFLVSYLLLQSEIPGEPYRRSANYAIRTNDTVLPGDVQLAL